MRPFGTRRPSDKRKHVRVDATAEVTIIPLIAGQPPRPFSVAVSDVSRQGIGIVYPRTMELGQQFILCLSFNEDVAKTRAVLCVVRRIEKDEDGQFRMGCEFTDSNRAIVPTDQVLRGLEKFQTKLFDADTAQLYGTAAPTKRWSITSLFRRKSA
jgi:hypothetical protein